MIDKPGSYKLSHEEYHADPAPLPSLSRSTIRDLINRTAYHAWFNHPRLNPNFRPEENGRFDVGTAAHSLLLEGIDNVAVVEADDWRTKAAREAKETARKEGKTPLLKYQYDAAWEMVQGAERAIGDCLELNITYFQKEGDSELSYFWQEQESWLRCRPDWISKDKRLILDYKTTEMSVNPNDLAKYILSMGLDVQAALYIRGVQAVEGIEPKFVFIFQEKAEPFICSFISLPPNFLHLGISKVDYGLYLWTQSMRNNEWPSYPNRVCYPNLPEWAAAAWENRAAEMGVGQ